MFEEYLKAGMNLAKYEILEDGSFFGFFPEIPRVFEEAETFEECIESLRRNFGFWILSRVANGLHLPILNGVSIPNMKQLKPEDANSADEMRHFVPKSNNKTAQNITRTEILEMSKIIAESTGASKVFLVGSVARGEAGARSNVNFLIVLPDELCSKELLTAKAADVVALEALKEKNFRYSIELEHISVMDFASKELFANYPEAILMLMIDPNTKPDVQKLLADRSHILESWTQLETKS